MRSHFRVVGFCLVIFSLAIAFQNCGTSAAFDSKKSTGGQNAVVVDSNQPGTVISKSGNLLLISEQERIYTIRPDGTEKKMLTSSGDTPSWTPDGKIIFVSKR